MSTPRSRYRLDAPADYSHRFHAGNVGDVWKHCVLVAVLERLAAMSPRVVYLDTHAGEGDYALGPTGEWAEGIGRIWTGQGDGNQLVARYLSLCRSLGAGGDRPERYPGSPAFARAVLGPRAGLALWDADQSARERLAAYVGSGETTRVTCGDGLQALADEVRRAEVSGDAAVALVDPPFVQKADWIAVPDAVARAALCSERATVLLWYPVKSLTRPNAMILRLKAAGVSGAIAELVTTPLEYQRRRLNGSGMLLVRPPAGTLEAIAAAAAVLGARCATRADAWSFRMASW